MLESSKKHVLLSPSKYFVALREVAVPAEILNVGVHVRHAHGFRIMRSGLQVIPVIHIS